MPIDETEDGYRGSSTVSRNGKQPKQWFTFGPVSDWLNAYVCGQGGQIMFVQILKEGVAASVPQYWAYDNSSKKIKLGDSVQVKIRKILNEDAEHKTRHNVVKIRLVDDFAERVRISNTNSKTVVLQTTARPVGVANDKFTMMLYNDTFGYFIDKDSLIVSSCQSPVTFEFISITSPKDLSSSIFMPIKIIKIHNTETEPLCAASPSSSNFRNSAAHDSSCDDRTTSVSNEEGFLKTDEEKRELYSIISEFWQYSAIRNVIFQKDRRIYDAVEKFVSLGP
ncbi:hypothetical protein WR25_15176 [Diploscapter pachys]|uniref:Uncharacterized protein n=1 Tax=Diploscapter pachys TaxID=2018661 RepID=A0A2A2KPD2_9BILA|nr:hypothetical protein WR25_15176 [Diploscapter pachys]